LWLNFLYSYLHWTMAEKNLIYFPYYRVISIDKAINRFEIRLDARMIWWKSRLEVNWRIGEFPFQCFLIDNSWETKAETAQKQWILKQILTRFPFKEKSSKSISNLLKKFHFSPNFSNFRNELGEVRKR
jgi:hypothetical protein